MLMFISSIRAEFPLFISFFEDLTDFQSQSVLILLMINNDLSRYTSCNVFCRLFCNYHRGVVGWIC